MQQNRQPIDMALTKVLHWNGSIEHYYRFFFLTKNFALKRISIWCADEAITIYLCVYVCVFAYKCVIKMAWLVWLTYGLHCQNLSLLLFIFVFWACHAFGNTSAQNSRIILKNNWVFDCLILVNVYNLIHALHTFYKLVQELFFADMTDWGEQTDIISIQSTQWNERQQIKNSYCDRKIDILKYDKNKL